MALVMRVMITAASLLVVLRGVGFGQFLCALPPDHRPRWAKKMKQLVEPGQGELHAAGRQGGGGQ